MPPNFTVAFIGDQGFIGDQESPTPATKVLELIQDEGADMVLHQGDFDYGNEPESWDSKITAVLGDDYPYFASVGNHDLTAWSGYQQKLQERLNRIPGATCTGDLGVKSACHYQGLFFILSGIGLLGTGHEAFLQEELAQDPSIWSICSWHLNQKALQVGWKEDRVGWGAYETCRQEGAIIATAHEHSYERTKTLSKLIDIETQTVDLTVDLLWPEPDLLRVAPGSTFVFVSGLGGNSVRHQVRCQPPYTYPYGCNGEWAKIYTSDQGATHGALFITFHVDGDPRKAVGYFKNIDNEIVDVFTITSEM